MLYDNKNDDVNPVTVVKKGTNRRVQMETKTKDGQNNAGEEILE